MTAMSRERLDAQRPISMPIRGVTRVVRATTLALLLSFAFVAAVAAQDASTPAASPAPEVTPAPEMPRIEVEIEELNDSGLSGTATLYDAGERVIVEFDLEGAGGNHPARIYEGVCGDMNPEPLHELENIDDNGQSATVIDATLAGLLEENHAIGIHLGPNQLGTLIGCADIEGEPGVPEGTPEASPESSPVATPPSDGTGGTQAGTSTTTDASDGTGGAEPTAELVDVTTDTETGTSTESDTQGTGGQQADVTTPAETPTPAQVAPTPTMEPAPSPTAAPTEDASTPVASTTGSSSDGTGGATSATTTTTVTGDGTAGVSGKGEPIGGGTSTLPQQAGVGAALAWPDNPADAAIWASAAGAAILGIAAVIVRRGELAPQTTPSRWSRLGL